MAVPARPDRRVALRRTTSSPAANFVVAHGPSFGPERWEEQSGFSPSTIAAEIAGLIAAADIADANHDAVSAAVWRGVADDCQRSIKGWTVTTNGPLAATRYFIRLSKTGDPNAAITYNVGNGGPTLDQRAVIDAGFLELVAARRAAGERPGRPRSRCRSSTRRSRADTASGPGWHRYNGDGYGDGASDGHPWAPTGKGTGHLWPALSAERGEQRPPDRRQRRRGRAAARRWRSFASGVGLIPEQDWELPDLAASPFGTDPTRRLDRLRERRPGGLGGAADLVGRRRSCGSRADLAAGKLVDQPHATTRPLRHAHAGHDDADRHAPGRPVGGLAARR